MTQVYVASVYANGYREGTQSGHYEKLTEFERNITKRIPHILESYHYINKQTMVDSIRRDNGKVFLDSGAFSAYTLGVTIDLPTYCQYIIQNQDIIIKDTTGNTVFEMKNIEVPIEWSEQSVNVFVSKYVLDSNEGSIKKAISRIVLWLTVNGIRSGHLSDYDCSYNDGVTDGVMPWPTFVSKLIDILLPNPSQYQFLRVCK